MLTRNETTTAPQTAESEEKVPRRSAIFSVFRGMSQFVLMCVILFSGFAGMQWLTSLKQEPPTRPPFKTVYTVDSVIARQGFHQPKFKVYGEVKPGKNVELRSLVAGPIVWVNPDLKIGARVNEGTELFKIDPFAFEKELGTARSNLLETTARIAENRSRIEVGQSNVRNLRDQLELAQSDLERITSLRDRGTATAKQVEDRKLIVSQRMQALEQAELNLVTERSRLDQLEAIRERFEWTEKQANRNLADTVLLAPLEGIVSQKNVSEGRLINANDMAVAMYEADRLEVRFTLTDQRFGRIQSDPQGLVDRMVEVIWNIGGEEFRYPARIDRIGAQITSSRGGVEVFAVIDELAGTSALRPGAFVEIIVPDRVFDNHFLIPETALYDDERVYVIVDGKIASRQVTLHAYAENNVIVTGEISDGDEIMVTRIAEISDGLRVQPPDPIPKSEVEGSKTLSSLGAGTSQ